MSIFGLIKCGTFDEFTIKISLNSSIYKGILELPKSNLQQFVSTPTDTVNLFFKEILTNPIKLTNNENKEVYELNVKRVIGANDTTKIIFYLKSIQGSETGNEIDLCTITLA